MVDFAVSQGRKQKVVDQLFKGLAGLMKGRGIVTFVGTGTLLPTTGCASIRTTVPTVRVTPMRVRPVRSVFEITGRHVVLASGSVPRTIPGFDIDGGWC